jgi:HK97 gp10 family phage protein
MAKSFDISMTGGKELQAKFAKLPIKMQRLVLRKALPAAAEPIAASARAKAPVNTGALAASIHVTKAKAVRGGLKVSIATGTREELGIASDAPGFYPMSQETGWTSKDGVHHPAHPYLRPALHENEAKTLSTIGGAIGSSMEELAR